MPADRIEQLIVQWEPAVRDAFLQAVQALRDHVALNDLVALIKAGNVDGAIAAVGLDPAQFRPLSLAIERTFEAGGLDATMAIKPSRGPLGLVIRPLFDMRAPAAVAWVQQHTTNLIRQITEDQRSLIREHLSPLRGGGDPMLTGQTPQKLALDLVGRVNRVTGRREGGDLGLTAEQAKWVRNYEASLTGVPDADALNRVLRDRRFDRTVARAIREGTEIPTATREAMIAAYRNRALRHRAETIANFEAHTALHQSQLEAWDQAIGRGVVVADKVRRFWITAGDDRVRPTHRVIPGMNAAGVGLKDAFNTPKGPQMYPPIDPGCRCRVRMRVVD